MGIETTQRRARSVLVAVDLTDASDMAVLTGVRMVSGPDQLYVLHTTRPNARSEAARIRQQATLLETDPEATRSYFQRVCNEADEWPHVRPRFHTRIGAPLEEILQFASDVEADLIVCGTHARHGVARLLQGSVAEHLVREAHCPVLVARPKDYAQTRKSDRPEPLCPDCAELRIKRQDPNAWCEVHGREHVSTHVHSGAGPRGGRASGFHNPHGN